MDDIQTRLDDSTRDGLVAFAFLQAVDTLGHGNSPTAGVQVVKWIDEWQLGRMLGDALRAAGVADARIWQLIQLIKIGLAQPKEAALETLLNDPNVAAFLNVNEFEGTKWFNKEQFAALTDWLEMLGAYSILRERTNTVKENAALIDDYARWRLWRDAEAKSEYQVEKLAAHASLKSTIRQSAKRVATKQSPQRAKASGAQAPDKKTTAPPSRGAIKYAKRQTKPRHNKP